MALKDTCRRHGKRRRREMQKTRLLFISSLLFVALSTPAKATSTIKMTKKPTDPVSVGDYVHLACQTNSKHGMHWSRDRSDWRAPRLALDLNTNSSMGVGNDSVLVQESSVSFKARKEDGNTQYRCLVKDDNIMDYANINVFFPNQNVQFTKTSFSPVQEKTVKVLECEADESYPAPQIQWYQSTENGWQRITTNITLGERPGKYGGVMPLSSIEVIASRDLNNQEYRCVSVYKLNESSENETVHSANMVLKVSWISTDLKMIEKPAKPLNVGDICRIACKSVSSLHSGKLPDNLVWLRNGKPVSIVELRGKLTGSIFPKDGELHHISVLEFKARKEDNSAKIACKTASSPMKETNIKVHFPPDGITFGEESVTLLEGETKNITCQTITSSNPAVTPTIRKVQGGTAENVDTNIRITNGINGGKMVTANFSMTANRSNNEDRLHCIMSYLSTQFLKTVKISVKFGPTLIKIATKPGSPFREGQMVAVTCESDNANPAAEIKLCIQKLTATACTGIAFDSIEKVDGPFGGRLTIGRVAITVDRNDDDAVYRCDVSGVEGRPTIVYGNVTFHVNYPARVALTSQATVLTEGEVLVLSCKAREGKPDKYSFNWYFEGKILQGSKGPEYRVKVNYNHGGTYKCVVHNGPGGESADNIKIIIRYKPIWDPRFTESTTVKASRTVTFLLPIRAYPTPNRIRWIRKKSTLPSAKYGSKISSNATTFSYKMTDVGKDDLGNYFAEVTNDVGTATFEFQLIADKPDPPCCLKNVNITRASLAVAYTGGYDGASTQKFILEMTKAATSWEKLNDRSPVLEPVGDNKTVVESRDGLDCNTVYNVRVRAMNDAGASVYGATLQVKTEPCLTTTEASPRDTISPNRMHYVPAGAEKQKKTTLIVFVSSIVMLFLGNAAWN